MAVNYEEVEFSMCRFQNAIEDEHGIKMLAIKPLDHNRKGLVLEMASRNCSYELLWVNGLVTLGRFYRGQRQMVYRGSPSVESEWNRMRDAVRSCEGKMAAEANRRTPGMTIDVEALKKNYAPKLDIRRRLRM